MARKKGSKVAVFLWGFLGIMVTPILLHLSIQQAAAETDNFKLYRTITKIEYFVVGDEEGHVIGVYDSKGLSFHKNGEVATGMCKGRFDSRGGVASFQGYTFLYFEDGSSQFLKFKGEYKAVQGAKIGESEATFEYIKGTGRFEGIKGSGSFAGKQPLYPESFSGCYYYDFTGTYTLPQK
jgi:hypothetical protein